MKRALNIFALPGLLDSGYVKSTGFVLQSALDIRFPGGGNRMKPRIVSIRGLTFELLLKGKHEIRDGNGTGR